MPLPPGIALSVNVIVIARAAPGAPGRRAEPGHAGA